MKSPGPIAVKAASIMLGFADVLGGTNETGGNNRGPQIKRFLASVGLTEPNPWCAAAVYHCIDKADSFVNSDVVGIPRSFPRSGYTPTFKNWGKANGLWIPASQALELGEAGDLACFYLSTMGRIAHIGIVYGKKGASLLTVEGNTGPEANDESAVERDGDGVYRKRRSEAELGKFGGLVRLPF